MPINRAIETTIQRLTRERGDRSTSAPKREDAFGSLNEQVGTIARAPAADAMRSELIRLLKQDSRNHGSRTEELSALDLLTLVGRLRLWMADREGDDKRIIGVPAPLRPLLDALSERARKLDPGAG